MGAALTARLGRAPDVWRLACMVSVFLLTHHRRKASTFVLRLRQLLILDMVAYLERSKLKNYKSAVKTNQQR